MQIGEIRTVAVLGAGTMGAGIAHVLARSGYNVILHDVAQEVLDRALATIAANLDREIKKGKITAAKSEILARINATTDSARLADADFAIEAVPERLDLKRAVLAETDRILRPAAILASNTSSISIATLAAATSRPDRFLGMHFMNPVPVMELVEVVRAPETSESTLATTMDLARALGKTPVAVNDAPGFVANRVLMPMINEAAFAVMSGVATPEAVDAVMRTGMNHPMGPLELADLIGIDVCVDILDVLEAGFHDAKYAACPLLRKMVVEGRLGRKSGRGFYTYER
jgi:3-hydroxybutyryl-CoA dehydrogenase